MKTATQANPWLTYRTRIKEIKREVTGISTYNLEFEKGNLEFENGNLEFENGNLEFENGDAPVEYSFLPGQFNMLYLPGFGESAISISSDAESLETVSHTVRVAGNVTQALSRHSVGDELALRGPFGAAWPVEALRGRDVVIACGGVGLAPLRPAIYHIIRHRHDYGRVILLYGARTPSDLLFSDEYDAWRDADIEVEVTVDMGDERWQGDIGVVPMLFYRLRFDAPRTAVLTCGPEIMMRFVIFEALARKIEKSHIYLSMERNMNCAIGLCGHCQLGPAFVCKDGPVFTYQQMEPYLNLDDF